MNRHRLAKLATIAALALLQVAIPGPTPFGLIGVGLASLGVELIQQGVADA